MSTFLSSSLLTRASMTSFTTIYSLLRSRMPVLKAYRVDNDPSVTVLIDKIETEIRNAAVCFAGITQDNPNVWYELGFPISANKPVVMVCSEERTKFPFDVSHRRIIRYSPRSPSQFQKLKE